VPPSAEPGLSRERRGQGRDPIRVKQSRSHGDATAHRQSDKVGSIDVVVIQHAHDVQHEVVEGQCIRVVIAVAVAAGIHRGKREVLGECRGLRTPVAAIAADAVQEEHERARAGDIQRDARRPGDAFHAHHRAISRRVVGQRPTRREAVPSLRSLGPIETVSMTQVPAISIGTRPSASVCEMC